VTCADALLGMAPPTVASRELAEQPLPVDRHERLVRRITRRLQGADLPTLRVVNDLLLGLGHLHAAWARPRSSTRPSPAR
jgi:hypothetical protein